MTSRKLLVLIADGMGDYPVPELDHMTPLQAARTPHMDAAAGRAWVGRCQTIPPSMPPGSDIANMGLLGYDPALYHTGRGPIEAAAQGLTPDPSDLIYRLNLCTVSEFSPQGTMLDHSAGHISTQAADTLIQALKGSLDTDTVRIVPGFQFRHLLIQSGGVQALEAEVHIPPPHDILNQSLQPSLQAFAQSPVLHPLVTQAHTILTSVDNPTRANAIWPWGQGRALDLPSFAHTYGLHGAVISAVDLVKGLGRAAAMHVPDIPGATGLVDTNYEGKIQAALDFLADGDFVFVHLEGPDECGHAGDVQSKIQAIERFDARIVAPAMQALSEMGAAMCVACDHLTPVSVRTHTPEPVPFLFMDSQNPQSGPQQGFSEATAQSSPLYIQSGQELLPFLLERMQAGGV